MSTENLQRYYNKHNDLKREMTLSRERGGAADIHKPLFSDNKSTEKKLEQTGSGRMVTMALVNKWYKVFVKDPSAQKMT